MIKSVVALYSPTNCFMGRSQIIRDNKSGQNAKTEAQLPYRNEKTQNIDSGLVQQLSLSVSATREDLAPEVEAGGGWGEHDQELLLQT